MKTRMNDLVLAEELILERCTAIEAEIISVANAAGRVLARDIVVSDHTADKDSFENTDHNKVIVKKGSVIRPMIHGTLVSMGIRRIEVYRKPMVGFYYLKSDDQPDDPDEIQSKSNRYILGNALREAEFSAIYQGYVPEESMQIPSVVKMASVVYDAVIICGGSAEKDFERMQRVMKLTGADIVVDHLDIKPGDTMCAGFVSGVPVFGITGTPEELLTALYLAVMPALKKIAGRHNESHDKIMVELDQDFDEHNEMTRILPGKLCFSDGIVRIHLKNSRKESYTEPLHDMDACAVIPAGIGPLKKGTLLNAYKIKR